MICAPCAATIPATCSICSRLSTLQGGHGDHMRAADLDFPDLHDGALRAEMAAGQFVGRDDAMALFHAFQDFEIDRVHVFDGTHSAEHRVHDAGGAVHGEAEADQAVDHGLDLLIAGTLLHHH